MLSSGRASSPSPSAAGRSRWALLLSLLALLTLGAIAPAGASAALQTIDGSPMNVLTSDLGNLQAQFDTASDGIFFGGDEGAAGFFLGFPDGPLAGRVYGPASVPAGSSSKSHAYSGVSHADPTGTGTQADPFTQVTVFKVADGADVLEVTQTVGYVNNATKFDVEYAVKNVSAGAVRFRATAAADLYVEGNDSGTGTFTPGPLRFVGGVNPPTGFSGGIGEVASSPWSHYYEDRFSTVWNQVRQSHATALPDTISDLDQDNGAAAQWDDRFSAGLPAGQTQVFKAVWYGRATAALFLTPKQGVADLGQTHQVIATYRSPEGEGQVNQPLRYTIEGANPGAGSLTTDESGQGIVRWQGASAGRDTITVFHDINGDSTRQQNEPAAKAEVVWIEHRPTGNVDASAPPAPDGSVPTITTYVNDTGGFDLIIPRATVGRYDSGCMPLTVSTPINPGTATLGPNVTLILQPDFGPREQFAMTNPSGNTWSGDLPCAVKGRLLIRYTLTEGGTTETYEYEIGSIALIDPQGVVYDQERYDAARGRGASEEAARGEAAITGATVRLQRLVGSNWRNVLSGDPGIAPNVNPQVTGSNGLYQWDVSPGQYRVLVSKDGYDTVTSRVVSIPPPVLDLHIAMSKIRAPEQPQPQVTPAVTSGVQAPVAKPKPCAGLKGKKLTSCKQKEALKAALAKTCGKLKKGKKLSACTKSVRAEAKCRTIKSKRKKATCVKKARALRVVKRK